ncbi:hypothetical protein [Virgibacillus sp. CBA3643]|uniref:hypothetical protein n=1 Tax=Virgibacillus sp. CBA3643 TaxID=2942278 RepID=UPI0035A2C714
MTTTLNTIDQLQEENEGLKIQKDIYTSWMQKKNNRLQQENSELKGENDLLRELPEQQGLVSIMDNQKLRTEIENLEKDKEDLIARLQVYENYVAGNELSQEFIEHIESDIEIVEEAEAGGDYSWETEYKIIEEIEAELDFNSKY